jgi:hypothetical protein
MKAIFFGPSGISVYSAYSVVKKRSLSAFQSLCDGETAIDQDWRTPSSVESTVASRDKGSYVKSVVATGFAVPAL